VSVVREYTDRQTDTLTHTCRVFERERERESVCVCVHRSADVLPLLAVEIPHLSLVFSTHRICSLYIECVIYM
jgi:hypothetical protein